MPRTCLCKTCVEVPPRRRLIAAEVSRHALHQVGDCQATHIADLLGGGIPFRRGCERTAKVGNARQEEMSCRKHAQALRRLFERMRELHPTRDRCQHLIAVSPQPHR